MENAGAFKRLGSYNNAVIAASASLRAPERIFFGTNVHVGHHCVFWPGTGTITVGNDVLFGPNVQIFASNHGTLRNQIIEEQPNHPADVVIEDDCWLGAGSIILAGVKVAKGTVVAAGSVVTKDTMPYSIVGGIPAKEIGSRK